MMQSVPVLLGAGDLKVSVMFADRPVTSLNCHPVWPYLVPSNSSAPSFVASIHGCMCLRFLHSDRG